MRKLVLMSAVVATMALATACSTGAKESTTTAMEETTTMETKADMAETTEAMEETKKDDAKSADEKELVGTLSDLKNVSFNVTDDKGTTYGFTFDGTAPEGFDTVKDGDKVKVMFNGELSEVDPITDIVSIEVVK